MSNAAILTDAAEGVFTITINRPEKLNALTGAMHEALETAFNRFAADPALEVCVLTGGGERAFCAGSDLSGDPVGRTYPPHGYGGIAARFDLDKPVIAKVRGLALGGGFELALACDMIVAADTARFGLPEPKVGLIALGGGIHRLVRQSGIKQAMIPLLTGRQIAAPEGVAMGFVSAVVAEAKLDDTVAALCAEIRANAPLAVHLTKQLAAWGLDQSCLADALSGQADLPAYRHWQAAEDTHEGPRAFLDKRVPVWKGR
ncbi:MAG: enoyl-CoA hydratase/isomerase family protein [Sphingomonadales bacterium]|nr:enoyl-CoA hydratase/isomerase family protein [Sphingomonadales bacterium]